MHTTQARMENWLLAVLPYLDTLFEDTSSQDAQTDAQPTECFLPDASDEEYQTYSSQTCDYEERVVWSLSGGVAVICILVALMKH